MIYTRPTTDGSINGYFYNDVDPGETTDQVFLTPEHATGIITSRDESSLMSRPYVHALHSPQSHDLFGNTVWAVPEAGIRITFPIPIKRIILYVGSDKIDNNRKCTMTCYDVGGVYRGGDGSAHPFGPVSDYPVLPEGAVPGTTDWQYMVYVVARNLQPPYGDGKMQPPCKYVEFDPGGADVYLGLTQAVISTYEDA